MSHGERIVLDGLFLEFDPSPFGKFEALHPGVDIMPLYGFDQGSPQGPDQPAAAFIRYQPGATVPPHQHQGYEHIFVLTGSQRDDRGTYRKGACVMNPPGTRHTVTSDEGCLVLAIWNQPVQVLP